VNILNYFSLWIIAYLIGIGLITYLVYIRIKKDWSKRVKAPKYQGDTYKGETFRNPLNLSIAVIAILAPLSSGLLAYQIGTNPSAKIDSLIVGILVMLVAMIWGVYLSYGIATQYAITGVC
jgi:phosphate/sulfate permease